MRWALGVLLFYSVSCFAVDPSVNGLIGAAQGIKEIIELANQRNWKALDKRLSSAVTEGRVLKGQVVGFLEDFGGKNLLPQATVFAAWKAILNQDLPDSLDLDIAKKQLMIYHDPEAVIILLESRAAILFWNENRSIKSIFPHPDGGPQFVTPLRNPTYGDSITAHVKKWVNEHPQNHATHDIQRLLKEAKSCQRDLA